MAASEVVASKSLQELLLYKQSLGRETQQLDQQMQQLVLNDYNRFIAATDTIKSMKTSLGAMESSMDGLVRDMRQMGGSSELVNESLQENRGKIEKLMGVKRLLVKLEFLFELPVRLKRAISLDAQAQAVRYYSMVIGVLRKHDHIPSLHRIRVEADGIMAGLKADLRAVLRESARAGSAADAAAAAAATASGRVVEAIKLLVQLEEPRADLRSAFLAHQKARLASLLATHAARYPEQSSRSGGQQAAAAAAAAAASSGDPSLKLLSPAAQAFYRSSTGARGAGAGEGDDGHGHGHDGAKGMSGLVPGALASPRPRATVQPAVWVAALNRSFLDAFKMAADLYHELFVDGVSGASGASSAAGAGADASAGGAGAGTGGRSSAASAAADETAEKRAASDALLAFAKEAFAGYLAAVRRQLSLVQPLPNAAPSPAAAESAGNGGGSLAAGLRGPSTRRTGSAASGASAGAGAGHMLSPPTSPAPTLPPEEREAERAKRHAVAAALAMGHAGSGADGGAAGAAGAGGSAGSGSGRFDSLSDALKLFLSDVRAASRAVPGARLTDRAQEVAEAVLRAQIDGLFTDVRVDAGAALGRLRAFAAGVLAREKAAAVRAAAGKAPHGGPEPEPEADAPAAASAAAARAAASSAGNPFGVPAASGSASGSSGIGTPGNPFAVAAPAASASPGNPFGMPSSAGDAARRPSGNPFALPAAAAAAAASEHAAPALASEGSDGSSPSPAAASAGPIAYDWLQVAGGALAAAAEEASGDVSARIDAALGEARPLVIRGSQLLPELSRAFTGLVHAETMGLLAWLASAWEVAGSCGSPADVHPARADCASLVVEADLGLERDRDGAAGKGGAGNGSARTGAGAGGKTGAGSTRAGGKSSSGSGAAARRRVLVQLPPEALSLDVSLAAAAAASGGSSAAGAGSTGAIAASTALLDAASAVEQQQAFALLLASLCRHFASHGVSRALDRMLTALPSRAELAALGVGVGAGAGASGPAAEEPDALGTLADVPELIKRVQASGRELLRSFVRSEAERLTPLVRQALTAGDLRSRTGEPIAVRQWVRLLLEAVAAARKLVACALREWDPRAACAAAIGYGVGCAALQQQPAAAGPSAASSSTSFGAGGDAGRRASGNPFADPATSGARVTAAAGNPFAAPPPPAAGGSGGASSAAARAGGAAAAAAASGPNAAAASSAAAARRTGAIVGAAGVAGVGAAAAGSGSGANPFAASGPGAGGIGSGLGLDFERIFRGLGEDSSGSGSGASSGGAGSGLGGVGSGGSGSLLVLGAVDYSAVSTTRVLLRVLAKAVVEWTRCVTLGAPGFQQMQVDIAALHLALPALIGPAPPAALLATGGDNGAFGFGGGSGSGSAGSHDPYAGARSVEELLNEAAVSAAERCLAPTPLPMSVIHALASEMLVGINLSL